MPTSIPKLRARLREIANALPDPEYTELHHIADEMVRRTPIKRAPRKSKHLSDTLKAEIRDYTYSHMDEANQDIGVRFKVNGGRVTDSLRGPTKGAE